MYVMGIESSCDETGIAIFHPEEGVVAEALYSQVELHADYGGVVPELASRDHVRKLSPLIQQVIDEAGIKKVEGIAYTKGPGLVGALLVGATVARTLAYAWQIPAVGVHHMEGHLLAPMLDKRQPEFPFVALLVSGGHTLLVHVTGIGSYRILGESVDDAAGEAFDKTAKLLGLGYPGGPKLAAEADKGDSQAYRFPRPMTDRPGLDFSFSGLKTYAANTYATSDKSPQAVANICTAFQDAVVDTLLIKCKRALTECSAKRLVIAGGVSANIALREGLERLMTSLGGEVYYPAIKYCTDNGAMIALAGYYRLAAGEKEGLEIAVKPRWPLDELAAIDKSHRAS